MGLYSSTNERLVLHFCVQITVIQIKVKGQSSGLCCVIVGLLTPLCGASPASQQLTASLNLLFILISLNR